MSGTAQNERLMRVLEQMSGVLYTQEIDRMSSHVPIQELIDPTLSRPRRAKDIGVMKRQLWNFK